MKHRKFYNIAGNTLMLLSFAFIVNRIVEYGVNFNRIVSFPTLIISVVSVVIYAILVIALATIFYFLLKIFSSADISPKDSIFIYCKSNLYKYLPGNIFHYIGRNQIALDNEISHGGPISATIAEMLLLTIAALITAIIFAGQRAIKWSLDNYTAHQVIIFVVLIVMVLLVGVILFSVISKRKMAVGKIKPANRIRFTPTLNVVVMYIIFFILNGLMFIALLRSIGGVLSNALILPVIGMYTLSWIIGFITPGAPAGLGIREAIMSALLSGVVGAEVVISAVVVWRVITILGDVVAYIIVHQLGSKGIYQGSQGSF